MFGSQMDLRRFQAIRRGQVWNDDELKRLVAAFSTPLLYVLCQGNRFAILVAA